jgi:chromosome segregation ATPase
MSGRNRKNAAQSAAEAAAKHLQDIRRRVHSSSSLSSSASSTSSTSSGHSGSILSRRKSQRHSSTTESTTKSTASITSMNNSTSIGRSSHSSKHSSRSMLNDIIGSPAAAAASASQTGSASTVSFGESELLRTKHIRTLEVLNMYEKRNEQLQMENNELQTRLEQQSNDALAASLQDTQIRLANAEGKVEAYFTQLQDVQNARDQVSLKLVQAQQQLEEQYVMRTQSVAAATQAVESQCDELRAELNAVHAQLRTIQCSEESERKQRIKLQVELHDIKKSQHDAEQFNIKHIKLLSHDLERSQQQVETLTAECSALKTKAKQLREQNKKVGVEAEHTTTVTKSRLNLLQRQHSQHKSMSMQLQRRNEKLTLELATAKKTQETLEQRIHELTHRLDMVPQTPRAVSTARRHNQRRNDARKSFTFSDYVKIKRDNERLQLAVERLQATLSRAATGTHIHAHSNTNSNSTNNTSGTASTIVRERIRRSRSHPHKNVLLPNVVTSHAEYASLVT